jgi:hypothetical protein
VELTTNLIFRAIERVGESHAINDAALDDANDAGDASAVNSVSVALATYDSQLSRLNALYAALDALTDDDVAALTAVNA